jgi:threonine synthase
MTRFMTRGIDGRTLLPPERSIVAARCPDCGLVVEAEVEDSKAVLPPQAALAHSQCSANRVIEMLNETINELSQYL